jgi:(1->4)-alpha-D-glucan 1-alpha-D-glucosylmutase
MLTNRLSRISEARLETRDFTLNALRGALLELIVSFPVYRSYVANGEVSEQDRQHIEWAVSQARQTYEDKHEGIFAFIRRLLLMDLPPDAGFDYRRRAAEFGAKFQQLTAPVMAKALEDTCFYRYTRLLSLNEVGSDPRRYGLSPAAFHRLGQLRMQYWPHSMLSTSTHDSKRSEDVRARLNVLSEMPREWRARVARWRRLNQPTRRRSGDLPIPSLNEEYLFYQTLVGTWPVPRDDDSMSRYCERLEAYMVKALREAKVNTSWATPHVDYEGAVLAFVRDVLTGPLRRQFIDDVDDFVATIAPLGFLNGLGQTLLKLASPGVPDIYQGNEIWQFCLVDPDNRQPIDYASRARLLHELEADCADPARLPDVLSSLCANLHDGRAKLYVTWRALALRARHPELFAKGGYVPLETSGARAEHICAFARQSNGEVAVAAVGRWFTMLTDPPGGWPRVPFRWEDTTITLPRSGSFENVLTGERLEIAPNGLAVRAEQLFAKLPVALLYGR